MKVLVNGRTKLIIGANEEDLQAQYDAFLAELEAVEDVEFDVQQVSPALLVVYTVGDAQYKDLDELERVGPRLDQPLESPHNQQWLDEAVADITGKESA